MADRTDLRSRLQRASTLYCERLPYALQQEFCNAFQAMDKNRDGRIAQAELVHWGPLQQLCRSASEGFPVSSCISSLFAFLDADASGELDFEECKSLFFIFIMPSEWCDGCGKVLLESMYECVECNRMKGNGLCADDFYLCSTCYSTANSLRPSQYPKPQILHRHQNFVEREGKLIAAMEEIIDQIKCSVCMSYHRGNVKGALLKHHIYAFEDNLSVCEWCIASRCAVCGTFFQGEPRTATSGGWAVKGSQICKNCQPFRTMWSNQSPKNAYSEEFFRKLASSDIFGECSTCIKRAKDGTLSSEFFQGISCSTGASTSGYGYRQYSPAYGTPEAQSSPSHTPSPPPHGTREYQFPQNGAPYPHSPSSYYMHTCSNSHMSYVFPKQKPNTFEKLAKAGLKMMTQNVSSFLVGDPTNIQNLMQMMQSAFSSIGTGSDMSASLDPTTIANNIGCAIM
ncbi:hypothetical protein KP509_07G067100 [Ceratopteris richardii]|uniref:EF-hand domain-containing protein n=1 Tax=Ceratopteris richardii TaxID=49495 RepID=A0A8T2UBR7_CERRI|nr:hypothetical protein KP509_07G067100 [Ceratopteris richardii]